MTRNVLFLCTGNSARSILAEALLNKLGEGRFTAYSAGSHPRGEPNPLALKLLQEMGHDTNGLRSKSWTEFAAMDAPFLHCVLTVCDNAKGETCPILPGHPVQTHWGIPDPAGETDDGKMEDFRIAYDRLSSRIEAMLQLDKDQLPPREWRDRLTAIGRDMEGAADGTV